MPKVKFTYALRRFYPDLEEIEVEGESIAEIVSALDQFYPKISTYLIDDQGALRKHVNIFIGNTLVNDKTTLGDPVKKGDEIYIMQALSGG